MHSTHVQECHSPQLCTVEAKAIWEAKVDLATRVASVTIGLGAWRGMGVEAAWDGFRMDVHPKCGVIVSCLSQTNINSTCKREYHPHGLMGPWTDLDLWAADPPKQPKISRLSTTLLTSPQRIVLIPVTGDSVIHCTHWARPNECKVCSRDYNYPQINCG